MDRASWRDRGLAVATQIVGGPPVVTMRRVLDRFGAADGGLLAAGIAYNAVLALIPLALLATGLAGWLVTDRASRTDLIQAISRLLPPLTGVVDEIVAGLARASPTLSILGLVLAAWGTSRLFAALESAIAQLDVGARRRGLFRRTLLRFGSVAILAAIVLAALVAAPLLAIGVEVAEEGTAMRQALGMLLAVVPPVAVTVALAAVYRIVPPSRPSWRAVGLPSVAGAVVLVIVTRAFVFITPRVFGTNLVYGTLGAVLVSLTWLNLVFTVILIGAAWVRERREDSVAAPS